MKTDVFLKEVRKIIREEIQIALESQPKIDKKFVAEALIYGLKSKINKSTPVPQPKVQPTKSSNKIPFKITPIVEDQDVRRKSSKVNPIQKRQLEFRKDTDGPMSVADILEETKRDLMSGTTLPLVKDQMMTMLNEMDASEYGDQINHDNEYDTDDYGEVQTIARTSADVYHNSVGSQSDEDIPDFLANAIARAAKVAEASKNITLNKLGSSRGD